jgi:hypothetical protein
VAKIVFEKSSRWSDNVTNPSIPICRDLGQAAVGMPHDEQRDFELKTRTKLNLYGADSW